MKTFVNIKNDFGNFEYCIRKWLCAAFFIATTHPAPMGVSCLLGNQYINGRVSLSSVIFRSNSVQQLLFTWITFLMEWVAFRHISDFELERTSSAKSLGM